MFLWLWVGNTLYNILLYDKAWFIYNYIRPFIRCIAPCRFHFSFLKYDTNIPRNNTKFIFDVVITRNPFYLICPQTLTQNIHTIAIPNALPNKTMTRSRGHPRTTLKIVWMNQRTNIWTMNNNNIWINKQTDKPTNEQTKGRSSFYSQLRWRWIAWRPCISPMTTPSTWSPRGLFYSDSSSSASFSSWRPRSPQSRYVPLFGDGNGRVFSQDGRWTINTWTRL